MYDRHQDAEMKPELRSTQKKHVFPLFSDPQTHQNHNKEVRTVTTEVLSLSACFRSVVCLFYVKILL